MCIFELQILQITVYSMSYIYVIFDHKICVCTLVETFRDEEPYALASSLFPYRIKAV